MKTNTASRIKQIMSERGIKQVDIIKMSEPFQKSLGIKMGKSTLSQYVNGIQSPDQDRLYLLSKTLGVSEPWLMGFDVAKERIPDSERGNMENAENHNELISIYTKLDDSRKFEVIDFAKSKLSEQQKAESEIYTLAAHSDDPNKKVTQEDMDKINAVLDEIDRKHAKKHEK